MNNEMQNLLEIARQGDNLACEKLLEENSGLVWSIVRRYNKSHADLEDLYQLGCLGFIKAVRGFDPEFGTQFSTYAVPKIAGEIRRFLRDDGMVKVSRSIKERASSIRQARNELQLALDREPSIQEISAQTGFSIEEIASTDLAVSSVSSLQAEQGDGGTNLQDLLGCEGPEEHLVEVVDLRNAIRTLSEREQSIILLRYYKGLTQDKIAKILNISQVQVSRLEKKSIGKLRTTLSYH